MKPRKVFRRELLKSLVGKMCNLDEEVDRALKQDLLISRDEMKDLADLYLADTHAFTNANLIRRKQDLIEKCRRSISWLINDQGPKRCRDCHDQISEKRTRAIPTAERCIHCQIDLEDFEMKQQIH